MKLDPQTYAAVAGRAECLATTDDMDAALDRMAADLTARLADKDPLVLCVMTGAVIVAGLLLPRLDFQLQARLYPCQPLSGYDAWRRIGWRYRPSAAIRGEHMLVLDDILDEGITLEQIVRACHEDGAASVTTAVLVEKRASEQPARPMWSAFSVLIAISMAMDSTTKIISVMPRHLCRGRCRFLVAAV
jgi:hypoxanthine phosphoribosyltransferase